MYSKCRSELASENSSRALLFLLLTFLLPTFASAIEIEGQVVASDSNAARIEVKVASSVRPGDAVRYVTTVAGRTLEAGRGSVIRIDGTNVESSIATGRVNVGMSALIELKRFIHEADTLAAIPGDALAVSAGVADADLDSQRAIRVCRDATKEFPDEARFHAQLARAYQVAAQPGRAVLSFNRALELEPDYPAALHHLAMIYRFGPVELQSFEQARERLQRAAELEFFPAMPVLGAMYRDGLGGPADHGEAARWFELSAEQDNAFSQNALGECYENGWGFDKDLSMALLWFRSSAEQGHPPAMRNLGRAFVNGIGVGADPDTALRWYKKAADTGDAQGQFELGNIHLEGKLTLRDFEGGIRLIEQAAQNNYAPALAQLGQMYLDGEGFKRDYEQAARNFFLGAKLDDPSSQYNYASLLERGSGVTRDKDLAIDFYRKAARQGHEASQERLKRLKATW